MQRLAWSIAIAICLLGLTGYLALASSSTPIHFQIMQNSTPSLAPTMAPGATATPDTYSSIATTNEQGTTTVEMITAVGVWATPVVVLLLSGIGWMIKNRFESVREELRNQYETELELLKGEIADRRELTSLSLSALKGGYLQSQEHVLTAVERLWNTVIEGRSKMYPYIHIHDILLPTEIESLTSFEKTIPDVTEQEFIELTRTFSRVEVERPFLGESLWRFYSVYEVFSGRLGLKVFEGRKKGQLYGWQKDTDGNPDTAILRLLKDVFSDDQLNTLIGKDGLGGPRRIMSALEHKMLVEMGELLFGKRLASLSVEEQQRIDALLRQNAPPHSEEI